ncbi:MAG: Hpt domain-containing protein [Alphaproteobacteria bacterium]|jgi:HPt (histidine-containing phosphotransfer) domain-containing protein|nr:Hpt domain-containing protein [Alphaproteobacteria bacterium]MBP9877047.1 Hpt domain-containing protein [Alphaproteobacteria bacterium]
MTTEPILNQQILSHLEELLGDSYHLVLETYISSSQTLIENLDEAMKSNDLILLSQYAHPLKSSSLQIGAVTLSECAAQIENPAKESDLKSMQELVSYCQTLHGQVISELRNILQEDCQ